MTKIRYKMLCNSSSAEIARYTRQGSRYHDNNNYDGYQRTIAGLYSGSWCSSGEDSIPWYSQIVECKRNGSYEGPIYYYGMRYLI